MNRFGVMEIEVLIEYFMVEEVCLEEGFWKEEYLMKKWWDLDIGYFLDMDFIGILD